MKCGKQIQDGSVYCRYCGTNQGGTAQEQEYNEQQYNTYEQTDITDKSIIVASVLLPIVGIIIGIININNGRKESGNAYITAAITSMIVCGLLYVIYLAVINLMIPMLP